MKFVNRFKSPNYNYRNNKYSIKHIIIHYTAIKKANDAINFLCDKRNQVSCHFLIDKSGIIYLIVNEKFRAWHAGHARWKSIADINSSSIGIEMDHSGPEINFEYFTKVQIKSLIELLKYLRKK